MQQYIEIELKNKNLDKYVEKVLIPKESYVKIQKGKKIKTERNYFPGYILIECEMNGEIIRTIKNIDGVIGFLGESKSSRSIPSPLRPNEVIKFLGTMDELNEKIASLDILFHIGETVKINDGPFESFQGSIEKIEAERKKVTINVSIFGRNTPVELNYSQIETIK